MTWQDLKAAVGAGPDDDLFVQSTFTQATELVDQFIGYTADPLVLPVVPDVIRELCYVKVGVELFNSRSRQGFAGFNDANGMPVRVSRDPLTVVYPLVRPYMVMF